MNTDKQNKVDYRWYVIRTLPRQERKLAGMLVAQQAETKNILEVYCPTHTTVNVSRNGNIEPAPLFSGIVFVLATHEAIAGFLERNYSEGTILYSRRKKGEKTSLMTIPEEQMRMFKDFNENYSDKMIILERPYSDYAFNPKTNEPNDIVKVIDGPLAGKEGYLTKFRRDRRLVFHVRGLGGNRGMAVSIPNIWNFHVVRLHNAENDRQTTGTMKEKAVDLLVGMIQGCGYGDKTLPLLYDFVSELAVKPSLVAFGNSLYAKGYVELSRKIKNLDTENAELILNLIRYEKEHPGYVKSNWGKMVIRPFLTPSSGVEFEDGQKEAQLRHAGFTEIIRRVGITEQVYYPSKEKEETVTTTYYAHIGIIEDADKKLTTLFANWDAFLGEYFMTGGKANEKLVKGTKSHVADNSDGKKNKEKLIESFRNYSPTLYNILAGEKSRVAAIENFRIGGETLNVFAIEMANKETDDVDDAKTELIKICTDICKEINTTTHLAVWRRYLRTVWLHV